MPNGKKYEVVIRATVTKTMCVEAGNEEAAAEIAHELFNIYSDGQPEDYNQETIGEIVEVH